MSQRTPKVSSSKGSGVKDAEFEFLIESWNEAFYDYPISTSIVDAETAVRISFYLKCFHMYRKFVDAPDFIVAEGMELITCVQFLRDISQNQFKVDFGAIVGKKPTKKFFVTYTINFILYAMTMIPNIQRIVEDIKQEGPRIDEEIKKCRSQLNEVTIQDEMLKDTIRTHVEQYKELVDENTALSNKLKEQQVRKIEAKEKTDNLQECFSVLNEESNELKKNIRVAELSKEIERLDGINSDYKEQNASLNVALTEKHKCIQHYETVTKRLKEADEMLESFTVTYKEAKVKYAEVEDDYDKKIKDVKKEAVHLQNLPKSMHVSDDDIKSGYEKIANLEKHIGGLTAKKEENLSRDEKLLQAKKTLQNKFVLEMRQCRSMEQKMKIIEEECKSMIKKSKEVFDKKIIQCTRIYDGLP